MVPIAFTSDHIETLYELDIEYGPEGKEVSLAIICLLASCRSRGPRT